jgi:hypothetical protein
MSPVDSVTVRVLEDVVFDPFVSSSSFAAGEGDAVNSGASGAISIEELFWGLELDEDDPVDVAAFGEGFGFFLNASMMVGCCGLDASFSEAFRLRDELAVFGAIVFVQLSLPQSLRLLIGTPRQ